jgi:hypothetical protein
VTAVAPALRTRFDFTLPHGYLDAQGRVHRDGVMRLATARDEIMPLRDPRVREHEAYLTVLLLSRVVESIGDVAAVTPAVIEGLFAADLAYLQDLYHRLNQEGNAIVSARCPSCAHEFPVDLTSGAPGESS